MDGASSSSKRRRGLGLVTQNACSDCRKKRAKCDGKKPSCSRCEASAVTCQYEANVRQSKDSLRNEIQQLTTYRQYSQLVLQSLAEEDKAADILDRLRSGEALESIAIRLSTGSVHTDRRLEIRQPVQSFSPFHAVFGQELPYPTMGGGTHMLNAMSSGSGDESSNPQYPHTDDMGFGFDTPHESFGSSHPTPSSGHWSADNNVPQYEASADWPIIGNWMPYSPEDAGVSQRDRGQEFLFGPESMTYPKQPVSFNTSSWTNITDDATLMDHLLALYFCWEYPTFASISKEHFIKDYRSGSPRFCSSLLVNALLALGSRFSDTVEVRGEELDGSTAGSAFYAEALRLLKINTSSDICTIQALGLLSIREASCGLDSDSWYHSGQSIRMACEMGLHRVRLDRETGVWSELEEVQTATYWGAFALNIAWSMMTGRLPHLSKDVSFMGKPSVDHRADIYLTTQLGSLLASLESIDWVPYTDDGMPLERHCTQTSNVRTIYKCFCELSEITHHALYIIYSPGNFITAGRLVRIYTTLLNWYGSLPEALRLGKNFTPAVLFVHFYYHTVILHLFRPFIKTRLKGSTVSPHEICLQAADSITALVKSYSQLYTLRRTPSFVPYIVLSSTLTFIIAQKARVRSSYDLNAKLLEGIKDLRNMSTCHGFARVALRILRFLSRKWDIKDMEGVWTDLYGEEYTSLEDDTGLKFSLASLNSFCPDVKDYVEGIGDMSSDFELFSVFPLTGLPLLEDGLEAAGFQMLEKEERDADVDTDMQE